MALPASRKQLQCMKQGGPFKVRASPMPVLAAEEVLIRQKVVALNLLDVKQRDNGIFIKSWPHVLGIEGAGVVEAVGSAVTHIASGTEVFARELGAAFGGTWGGAYQEFAIVPASEIVEKPSNMTLTEAASLPICYSTAVYALYYGLNIPLPYIPGTSRSGSIPKSILILGGASATGASAIQLLRMEYPSMVILTTSSMSNHAHLGILGATKAFDYHHSSTLANDIKMASPGGIGVDLILDCVSSGASQKDLCNVFAEGGPCVYASINTGLQFNVPAHVTKHDITAFDLTPMQGWKNIMPTLKSLIEKGRYKLPLPVKVIGHKLEDIPKVIDQMYTVSGAKLVVTLDG